MHPINYSLFVNTLSIACLTGLAAYFNEPWMVLAVVLAIVLQTHALQKFGDNDTRCDNDNDDDNDDGKPIGFLTDLT